MYLLEAVNRELKIFSRVTLMITSVRLCKGVQDNTISDNGLNMRSLTYNSNNRFNYNRIEKLFQLLCCFSSLQDLIDEWKAKEIKRGNSNKTIDPTSLKWTPPKGT